MVRKAAPEPTATPDMGTFHRQLQAPEAVGEISAAEAKEIKTLNEMVEKLRAYAIHAQRLLNFTVAHRMEYLTGLVRARGLPLEDLYNVNDDSGQILRTHELVTPAQLAPVEDPPAEEA